MPDYTEIFKQKQAEKDKALGSQKAENILKPAFETEQVRLPEPEAEESLDLPTRSEETTPEQEAVLFPEGKSDEQLAREITAKERFPIDTSNIDVPDNPYTWSPEFTQRGYVEEAAKSLVRGFGKSVVGSMGEMLSMSNGIIGESMRDGNMVSRWLMEAGKDLEEGNGVYIPEEMKNPEFKFSTFMNPDIWTKEMIEYVPQLVEMVYLSRAGGRLGGRLATSAVEGAGRVAGKEALKKAGASVSKNTGERVAAGAAEAENVIAGQGSGFWKYTTNKLITKTGKAMPGVERFGEVAGGALSMNILAGLQNAGALVQEMGDLKDANGNPLYTDGELGAMANNTMINNIKYLPVDALSYALIYGRNAAKTTLNPLRSKLFGKSKKFFDRAEQAAVVGKGLAAEVKPMLSPIQRALVNSGKFTAELVPKALFEGFEETFQETFEDWSTKKARARVTGEKLGFNGGGDGMFDVGLEGYFDFYMSRENEHTKVVALGLGLMGGAASGIVEQINRKAESAFKNYHKTELMKHAAVDEKGYTLQSGYIKEQLIDNIIEGGIDNEAMLQSMLDDKIIDDEMYNDYTLLSKKMEESYKTAADLKINVAGRLAYLNNAYEQAVLEQNIKIADQKSFDTQSAIKEKYKNDPTNPKLQKELDAEEKKRQEANEILYGEWAEKSQALLSIADGNVADISNIKYVTLPTGEQVAVGLSQEDWNNWYNMTDEQVYEKARKANTGVSKGILDRIKSIGRKAKETAEKGTDMAKKKFDEAKNKMDGTDILNEPLLAIPKNMNDKKAMLDAFDKIENKINKNWLEDGALKEENFPDFVNAVKAYNQNLTIQKENIKKEQAAKAAKKTSGKASMEEGNVATEEELNNQRRDELVKGTAEIYKTGKYKGKDYAQWTDFENEINTKYDNLIGQLKEESTSSESSTLPVIYTPIEQALVKAENSGDVNKAKEEISGLVANANIDMTSEETAKKDLAILVDKDMGILEQLKADPKLNIKTLLDYLYNVAKETNPNEQANETEENTGTENKTGTENTNEPTEEAPKKKTVVKKQSLSDINKANLRTQTIFNNPDSAISIAYKEKTGLAQQQSDYEAFLASNISRAILGNSKLGQTVAINQHLRRMFPELRPNVVVLNNMYRAIGQPALGYTLMSTIFIDEKKWDQGYEYMHEFLHIHFALTSESAETKGVIKEALKNKRMVEKVKALYGNSLRVAFQSGDSRRTIKPFNKLSERERKMFQEQLEQNANDGKKRSYVLPDEKQPLLLEELFVHYMQGPMSEKFSKFFEPTAELDRIHKAKGWWKSIKNRFNNNQDTANTLLDSLKDVAEPITNMQEHIMTNFISRLQGKDVSAQGRMSLEEDEQAEIFQDNKTAYDTYKEQAQKTKEKEEKLLENNIFKVAELKSTIENVYEETEEVINAEEEEEKPVFDVDDVFDFASETEREVMENLENPDVSIPNLYDSGYNMTAMKMNKFIKYFIRKYNQTVALKDGKPISTKLIKEKSFTSLFQSYARNTESFIDFIRLLENSTDGSIIEFVKYLKANFSENWTEWLRSSHFLYTNTRTVNSIKNVVDEKGAYETQTAFKQTEKSAIKMTVKKVLNDSMGISQTEVQDALSYIYANKGKVNANNQKYVKLLVETFTPNYQAGLRILESTYINYQNKTLKIASAITQMMDNSATTEELYEAIAEAMVNTSRQYSSISGVDGPTGNMESVKMINNNLLQTVDDINQDLRNSKNLAPEELEKAKRDFLTKYSNDQQYHSKNVPNHVLESIWENFQNDEELVNVTLDFGSENKMLNRGKKYKDTSPKQQILSELLGFLDSFKKGKSYLAALDLFGNSSRSFKLSVARIDKNTNAQGQLNIKGKKLMNELYKLYTQTFEFNEPGVNPPMLTKEEWDIDFAEGVEVMHQYMIENAASLMSVDLFKELYDIKDGHISLNEKGMRRIAEYELNRIANTFYTHQIINPNMPMEGITKKNKGNIAPIMVLDPNLLVESIVMPSEYNIPAPQMNEGETVKEYENSDRYKKWKKDRIITNDGMQYVFDVLAYEIEASGKGAINFNKAYKLMSQKVEKNNPFFLNKMNQMKGFTTVLSLKEVTENQPHLKPIYELMVRRYQKFQKWYKAEYGEDYDPTFRSQTEQMVKRPKYMNIVTPLTVDKLSFFKTKEFESLQRDFTLDQLQNPMVMEKYEQLLDNIYWQPGIGATKQSFKGVNGSNFGPQQVMDKKYKVAKFSTQAQAAMLVGSITNSDRMLSLRLQELLSLQKKANLQEKVLQYISERKPETIEDFRKYSKFIYDTASKFDSDAYTMSALLHGKLLFSPHISENVQEQFRARIIDNGNNMTVSGTYGQTISDMGFRFTTNENLDAYIDTSGRDLFFPEVKEQYINATNKLNFYGEEISTEKDSEGNLLPGDTIPFEAVLPYYTAAGKNSARARKSFYGKNGGRDAAEIYLTAKDKSGKYIHKAVLQDLKLLDGNGKINFLKMQQMLDKNKIYKSPNATKENQIGTFIRGETVMVVRIPNSGPSFMGVAEVVGFHTTDASNIIVPSKYAEIIGADNDGDALFVYKAQRTKNGFIDKDVTRQGYWNQAFELMVQKWTSPQMREMLTQPLVFEKEIDKIISEIQVQTNDTEKQHIPASTRHFAEEFNNAVTAKQTLGKALNAHRFLSTLAFFRVQLIDGEIERNGKPSLQPASISLNGKKKNQFSDVITAEMTPGQTRQFVSNILANIVIDSSKNGHSAKLKLNDSTINAAMVLVNLGFGIKEIGMFFNHPMAKEWIQAQSDIGNDYIDNGSRDGVIWKFNQKYPGVNMYQNHGAYKVITDPNHPQYSSEENNMDVLRLFRYLMKLESSMGKANKILRGHNTMDINPLVLEHQVKDFKDMLSNKVYSKRNGKNQAVFYFIPPTNPVTGNPTPAHQNIQNAHEFNHYIYIAEKLAQIQKNSNIVFNEAMKDVLKKIETEITGENLTDFQRRLFSKQLKTFIYSRFLGMNNMSFEEKLAIYEYPEGTKGKEGRIPLVDELNEYIQKLDSVIYNPEEINYADRDTDYTRSFLFSKALEVFSDKIRLNSEALSDSMPEEHLQKMREEFKALPEDLKRKMIAYDLDNYSWSTKASMYAIFNDEVTDYIDTQAVEFMTKLSQQGLNPMVKQQLFEVIRDLQIFEPKSSHFPIIYMEDSITYDKIDESARMLYKGIVKKMKEQIYKGEPFHVKVLSKEDSQNQFDVIKVYPPNMRDIASLESSYFDRVNLERARETGYFDKLILANIISQVKAGTLKMYHKAIPNLPETKLGTPESIYLTTIQDRSTNPIFTDPDGNKVNEEVGFMKGEKKSSDEPLGRMSVEELSSYTGDKAISPEDFNNAYRFTSKVTEEQKELRYNDYLADKKEVERLRQAEQLFPEDIAEMDAKELMGLYNRFGNFDEFAAASVIVPVLKAIIDHSIKEQSVITQQNEDGTDIGPLKAWFMANNIPSNHPATQSVQRSLEIDFKEFINERKAYFKEINSVSEALYAEKFNYNKGNITIINRLKLATMALFKNRSNIYTQLYGGIVDIEPRIGPMGNKQKRFFILPEEKLREKLANKEISQAEFNFAMTFTKITNELNADTNPNNKWKKGTVPSVAMSRAESFSRKGLLGVLVNSRPLNQSLYDVRMNYQGLERSYKEIEDIFRQENDNNFKNIKEFVQLTIKAKLLLRKGTNENGKPIIYSNVFKHTLMGDGMKNSLNNGGWVNEGEMLSMDLNKALTDFAHVSLFVNGNGKFKGFINLQSKIDALLLHNNLKGYSNMNKFVKEVHKNYFLKANKDDKTVKDGVIDAFVKGNLLYIMGWKLFAVGKGAYVIGNSLIGKYNNIKNQGGRAWLNGEIRFWGLGFNGEGNRKASGILNTLNYMDINLYDQVSISQSSGFDKLVTDLALLPMMVSEKWVQQVHYLGMLTDEQWNKFDNEGNYKPGVTHITNEELIEIENTVKNSHGKGYTPTDQRMIQRYSWGRAMMQFSRFIPTMVYDRFAEEDINIYGKKHIGSLRAVYQEVIKIMTGEIKPGQLKAYLDAMDPQYRERVLSGLKGMAMVSLAMLAGQTLNSNYMTELGYDANYLFNDEKLAYKIIPSSVNTLIDVLKPITGS